MLTSETKRRIDSCRDILVGKLPLPSDQVELITLALIYKFMDDLDEDSVRLGGRRSFFVEGLAKYRWRALMPQTISADERMTLFAEGIETLGGARANGKDPAKHLPPLFRDIFRNEFLKFRDGRTLTLFLTEINGFSYSHGEELGDAFEYLLQCMGTQGENGQFLTPRHIIDFMVACLDPKPTDRILDPSCGTCGFLVSSFRHILAAHTSRGSSLPGDRLSHDQRQQLYRNFTGYDITDLMVKLSKVNLFLHGFPDPAIHIYDTLTNDARWNDKADLILANPPFMTPKGGVTPHARFRVAAKKAEVLFTDYIAEHLSADGRGAVIVPNGIVATTQNAYVALRRFLVEDSLVAVVSLPAGVFKPYSGVKTSILFLDKALARRTDQILFLKISADGFDLGDQRRQIEANDLPEAERVVKAWMKGKLGEAVLAWRAVEKHELLANKHVLLATERFLGENGVVSDNHPTSRLADVADYVRGLTYAKGDEAEATTNNVVLRAQNVSLEEGRLVLDDLRYLRPDFQGREDKRLREGDILVCSSSGSKSHLGKVAFVDSDLPYFFGGFMGVLRSQRDTIEPRFLFRLLTSQHHKAFLSGLTEGANINNLKLTEYLEYEIPLPPLEEQRRIVEEIEGYQKIVDGARQILAAYCPRYETGPDWPIVPLESIFKLTSGKFLPEKARKDGEHPVYGGNGIMGYHNAYFIVSETLVIGRVGAYCGAVHLTRPKAWITDNALYVTNWLQEVDQSFIAHAVREANLNRYAKQGGQPYISQSIVGEVEIALPPLEEQRRIVEELDAEAAQIEAVRALVLRNEARIQRVLDRVWNLTD